MALRLRPIGMKGGGTQTRAPAPVVPPPGTGLRNFLPIAAGLQAAAAAAAPSTGMANAVQSLDPSVVAHIASVANATVDDTDGGTEPDETDFWQTVTLNEQTGIRRKKYPVVPLYAQAVAAAGQAILTFIPTQPVFVFRLGIPSGQVTAGTEVIQSLVANQRLVNGSSAQGAPITCFSERSKGGKISVGKVPPGQPITLTLAGCTNAQTYYAFLLAYGLFAGKGGPSDGRPPDYVGWIPLGQTTIGIGASTSIPFTPNVGFRPRLFCFDDSEANFANVLIGQVVEGVMLEGATNNANTPAVAMSELAEDDYVDYQYIPANTPCSLPASNTNLTATAKLGGHVMGDCWLPTND